MRHTSDYLVHFLRQKNPADIPEGLPEPVEHAATGFKHDLSDMDPFAVMLNILEEGGIRFGHSFRGGQTTIYGGDPVICFTEMPLSHLLDYNNDRNREDRVSAYAIALKKVEAFRLGARPAIYGLSQDNAFQYARTNPFEKVLCERTMPLSEQYRFVPLRLDADASVDWTHEREWRLKYAPDRGWELYVQIDAIYDDDISGLPIFDRETSGLSEVILVVATRKEAEAVQEISRIQRDAGSTDYGAPFDLGRLRIVMLDSIARLSVVPERVEDIPSDCYFVVSDVEIESALLDAIGIAVDEAKRRVSKEAADEFIRLHPPERQGPNWVDYQDACGDANVRCSDPNHPVLRGMLQLGVAQPSPRGYFIKAVGPVAASQSITYNEYVADRVSQFLNERLAPIFRMESWLD